MKMQTIRLLGILSGITLIVSFTPLSAFAALQSNCFVQVYENGRKVNESSIIYSSDKEMMPCQHGNCAPFKCERATFIKSKNRNLLNINQWMKIRQEEYGCNSSGNQNEECEYDYQAYKKYLEENALGAEYTVTFDLPMNMQKEPLNESNEIIAPTSIKVDLIKQTFEVFDNEKSVWPLSQSKIRSLYQLEGALLLIMGIYGIFIMQSKKKNKKPGLSHGSQTGKK